MDHPLIELKNASVHYAGVKALEDVSLAVHAGEVVALMGPNGAGKSTALRALFGLVPLTHGAVAEHGRTFTPRPFDMVRRGVAYVPQGRQVFKNLTVFENLELGGYGIEQRGGLQMAIESVLELFPVLKEKRSSKAGTLSGGQQQMLTIGRGLVAQPRVLLLDEPSLGLAPKVVKEVFETVHRIHRERSIAIVVVEHSIKSVLEIADRACIFSLGRIVAEGGAKEIENSNVLEKVFFATP